MEYARAIRARLHWVLLSALAGLAVGAIITITQVPVFRAHTSVKLPEQTSGVDAYAAHAKMIQSEALKAKAMASLRSAVSQFPPAPADRITKWRGILGMRAPSVDTSMAMAGSTFKARVSGYAPIIDLYCDSSDPRVAAVYVNLVANSYVRHLNGLDLVQSGTGNSDAAEIEKARKELERSEAALQQAEQASATGGALTEGDIRRGELTRQIEQARAERDGKLSAYTAAQAASNPVLARLSGDAPLQNLLLQVDEIKKRIEQLSTKYTPAHPAMMEAQKKLDELQATVAAQRADDLQRFRLDYETAKQAEDRLRASQRALAQPPPQGPALSTLQREVAAKRQNYDRLVEKTKQVQSPLPGQASVVDQAVAPPIPYRPDPVGTLAFGAFGGLLLGLAGVVLRERLDRTIRAPGEAVTYSGSAELGFIPAMKVRGNAPGFTVELAVWQQKMSLTSAAFSAAATSLLFSFDGDSPLAPLVVLTSVAPMEGKTTSACNLAVAAAEARRRVLLIDGDLIKPRLHTVFNLTNDFGLSNLLASEDPLDETALSAATQPSGFPGLDVLPNGNHEASMTELLHSPRLTELFHLARARYQVVLVDAPPMPQIPIARVMGKMGDGVILVVRAGKTHREMLQRAAGTLRDDGIHIIGTLLNGWDMYGRGGYGYEAYTETYKRYGAGAR